MTGRSSKKLLVISRDSRQRQAYACEEYNLKDYAASEGYLLRGTHSRILEASNEFNRSVPHSKTAVPQLQRQLNLVTYELKVMLGRRVELDPFQSWPGTCSQR